MVNRKGLKALGYDSPEEIIGKTLRIEHEALGYIPAFAVATPAAYIILQRWLRNFAYKTCLDWWIFAGAGITVLLLSGIAVSWQSWHAATANPANAIRKE